MPVRRPDADRAVRRSPAAGRTLRPARRDPPRAAVRAACATASTAIARYLQSRDRQRQRQRDPLPAVRKHPDPLVGVASQQHRQHSAPAHACAKGRGQEEARSRRASEVRERSRHWSDRPPGSAGGPVLVSGSAQTSNHRGFAHHIGAIPVFLIDDNASGLPSASMKARPISGEGDDTWTPADQTV
jgi:hypothetical protein